MQRRSIPKRTLVNTRAVYRNAAKQPHNRRTAYRSQVCSACMRACIKPLRIAFDHLGVKKPYETSIRIACNFGLTELSNYMLYNFHDTPADLYERMALNVTRIAKPQRDSKVTSASCLLDLPWKCRKWKGFRFGEEDSSDSECGFRFMCCGFVGGKLEDQRYRIMQLSCLIVIPERTL
jgi:hypothetical protein